MIVSNIAGTTRDAIDSYFENEFGKYLFIDTAGMRRKSKVDDAVEKYSNLRSVSAIERADVCLILIDANEGVTEQDTKVAGLAHEAGQGVHHCRQQVGHGRKGHEHDGREDNGRYPPRPQLYDLRAGRCSSPR